VNYELIIIRYAEIGLKAKYTRKKFENTLIENIKKVLKQKKIEIEIKKHKGRIYIYSDQIKKIIPILKSIFGMVSFSPAIKIKTDKTKITEKAVELTKNKISKKDKFALRVTRDGKHSFTSQDIAIVAGDAVVKKTSAKVDLTKPDYELFIEIRNNDTFFYEEKIPAPGGLPIHTQGKVLAIIDTKDSILAAWYIIRRGCSAIFVISDKKMEKTLEKFIKKWFLNFSIITTDNTNNFNDKINKIAIEKNCKAIITGHTLYKNKEKTLKEIKNYKKNMNLPVIHPLIAFNKDEINKKLEEIGIKK